MPGLPINAYKCACGRIQLPRNYKVSWKLERKRLARAGQSAVSLELDLSEKPLVREQTADKLIGKKRKLSAV